MDQGPALIAAIMNHDEKRVKLLLDQKANPNYESPTFGMSLYLAMRVGYSTSIVESLVLAKADIHYRQSYMGRTYSLLRSGLDISGYVCHKKSNTLLHFGLSFSEAEKEEVEQLGIQFPYYQHLLTAHNIIRERVARCRRLCIALWTAPFHQHDLRTWWIRELVWSTRHDAVWTPDLPMPEGYT